MKMELFKKKINAGHWRTLQDMRMLSDLQLIYMVSRNSTQLLNINTTKFQVEREPVYNLCILYVCSVLYVFFDFNEIFYT